MVCISYMYDVNVYMCIHHIWFVYHACMICPNTSLDIEYIFLTKEKIIIKFIIGEGFFASQKLHPRPESLEIIGINLRFYASELWCWRLLRVPWTARRSNQSVLKEISPGCSLEGLMLKLQLYYFDHLMQRAHSLEKTLMLGKIEGKRRRE